MPVSARVASGKTGVPTSICLTNTMATTNKKKAGLLAAYLLSLLLAVGISWDIGYNSGKRDQKSISECQSLADSYINSLFLARSEVMDGDGEEYRKAVFVAESLHEEIMRCDLSKLSDSSTLQLLKRAESSHDQIFIRLNFVRDQGGVAAGDEVNMKALEALRKAEALINGID